MSRIQFIGRVKKDTIFYNFETKEAIKAINLNTINMKAAKKAGKQSAGLGFVGTIFLSGVLNYYKHKTPMNNHLSLLMEIIIVIITLLGAIAVDWYFHTNLYPKFSKYELATKSEFSTGFKENVYYKHFEKHTSILTLIAENIFYLFMVAVGLIVSVYYQGYSLILGIILIPVGMFITGIGLLYLIQYNNFRYRKIEKLFKEDKIKFKAESNVEYKKESDYEEK